MEEALFSMTLNLCSGFPALDPFTLQEQRFHDVVLLCGNLRRHNEAYAARRLREANGGESPPDGSFVIGDTLFTPAQNDDWW